jgi:hypothetical protein
MQLRTLLTLVVGLLSALTLTVLSLVAAANLDTYRSERRKLRLGSGRRRLELSWLAAFTRSGGRSNGLLRTSKKPVTQTRCSNS